MDKITKLSTKVVRALIKSGMDFASTDSCPDQYFYEEIDGREITIGEDNNRNQWEVMLEDVTRDGKPVSFQELSDVLTPIFGVATHPTHYLPPDYKLSEPDMNVNNWKIGKKVLVVQRGNALEIYQDFVKQ